MKYTYLLVNFFTIIVPFLFSFHPKLRFHKTWRAFFPAVIGTALFFLVWDEYYTHLGIWGFNKQYVIGIYIFDLPLEEVLFFFCIPYACVFTYHCLDLWIKFTHPKEFISPILIVGFLCAGFYFLNNAYTLFAFLSSAVFIIIAKYIVRVNWMKKFYLIFLILLIPFLIVNGVLTGTGLDEPVVWYNENEIIGWRILTIPFEDIFYAVAMILMNLLIYKSLLKNEGNNKSINYN